LGTGEIPGLKREVEQLRNASEKALLGLEEINSQLSQASLEERRISLLKKRCEDIGRTLREANNLSHELSLLEQEMDLILGGDISKLEGLEAEMSRIQTTGQSIQSEIDALGGEMRMRQNDLTLRQSRFRDLKERALKTQVALGERLNLGSTKLDLESTIGRLEGDIAKLDADLTDLNIRLAKAQEERSQILASLDAKAKEGQNEVSGMVAKLLSLENEAKEFSDPSTNSINLMRNRLEAIDRELSGLGIELQRKQQESRQIANEIVAHSKKANEVEMFERQLKDNLCQRELGRRKVDLSGRLQESRNRLCGFNRSDLQSQLQRHQLRLSDLMGERSGLLGEMRQLEDQVGRLQKELEGDYPGIEGDYRAQYIKCEAMAMGGEDLEKYAKALDQAIMKYHSTKMDEINKLIRELWTNTYAGGDIDTVEIRADNEAGTTNRSYNYRVVMIRGDQELDMRGRSSAGQRVLTSLIIRLALAETFGLHCGVLALDEPTTNLDRDNIEGLAESLADIIKARRAQSNFQFLIITHDEDFVQLLGRHQCADYYWRISKDEQQRSAIERQSMTFFS
jgi:DNA repair protein RAD50